ncbi:MAG: carboxymuconolactone decarboxylase family protein [Deltaproteobacteria bacterium]|nr:carboxymuconolactone decarboxylase family protein [Deltaproteobacteria bacterium]
MDATDALLATLPAHTADLAYDLAKVLGETRLNVGQRWGCAMASAVTLRDRLLTDAFATDAAAAGVASATLEDARAAAALMAMNNVYYRFVDSVGGEHAHLPAGLRMKRVARPAGSKADFELFALAASALNGCQACMRHHEAKGRAVGLDATQLHDAVRVAAAVRGTSVALFDRGDPG